MKPVMASLKQRYGDKVTWHFHEFNQPDSAEINRDFQIEGHPMIFILDHTGRLVRKFAGVVEESELVVTLNRLIR